MKSMRAKMVVISVLSTEYCEELKMNAVSKKEGYGEDGLDEDNTFATFTPTAELKMQICNPALKGQFNPGQVFYVDFTEADNVQTS